MSAEGWRRPARAEISVSAIVHNAQALRAVLGSSALIAVVKANGYGHGVVNAARAALEGGADSLAVALVDEGVELREAGIVAPILLLAETPADTIADALRYSLTLTIGSLEGAHAAVASATSLGGTHPVHLKIDTGMHRMGVAPDKVAAVVEVLRASPAIDLEGLYTHFSVADGASGADRAFTRSQIES
ncbi:MAG TPA: alanine racemase, partial [Acidimicrobiales bacterium]